MNPPSIAINNLCAVKKCCAICRHGEYQDNMVLCASDGDNGELEHHEFNDVCNRFVVDSLLECTPEERVAHLVSYIKELFPRGCADIRHCYDCVLHGSLDGDCMTAESYICGMLQSLEDVEVDKDGGI